RNDQKKIFADAERSLWSLLKDLNEFWIRTGDLIGPSFFTEDFSPSIKYEDAEVIVDRKQQLETLTMKLDAGFTSYRRALAEANPELTSEEVDELIEEIENEKLDRMNRASQVFQEDNNGDSEQE
ncbi:MAG: hypothetical protein NWE76_06295, partial [Candidatus Bathyarchaeota archaeon]|nr:hypothetical protein [Candidatus Bathyarchaeota archaeon]